MSSLLCLGAPAAPAAAPVQAALNVQGADIRAFIDGVARSTGRTFIVDPDVSGTVTVSSRRPLGRAELFEVFLSTLRANGLIVVPTASGAYRISGAASAARGPATTGGERFSTEVFALTHIDAASAAETIRPLVGPEGQVLPNAAGNSVVVADFADNLARIRSLIQRVDVDRSAYEVVTLGNASAREIAAVLNQVLAPRGGSAGQGMVSVTPVESSNSLVLRGDPDALDRVRGLVVDLDGRASSSDDVRVVYLQHADAEQLLPVLQQVIGERPAGAAATTPSPAAVPAEGSAGVSGAASAAGRSARIARFPGANALVISASPDMQATLADVIRALDIRRQQVLIEAIVVELSDTAVRELGVQWLLAGGGRTLAASTTPGARPGILPLAGGALAESLDRDDPRRETLQDAAVKALLTANGFVGGTLQDIGEGGLLGFVVNAARADAGSNLLQTPSLMTLDNEEATILVGQEVPITTGETLLQGAANPFRTTERQDIGVKLVVRPQINAGGSITLSLRQEVSSINGILSDGASDLVLNKRELETTLVLDDGAIAVAGGLLEQTEQLSTDRVPGVSRLPIIGGLFRSSGRQRGRTNLMVFIRPTIVRSAEDASTVSARRWDYMRDRQREAGPDAGPSLDVMLRDYIDAQPPAAPGRPDPAEPAAPAAPLSPVADGAAAG